MRAENNGRRRVRLIAFWVMVIATGLVSFLIGINPDMVKLNRVSAIGFVQMALWLVGLGLMIVGAFAVVHILRRGRRPSLRADIGVRLVATGYVITATASLADFLGIGTHLPSDLRFGRLQWSGFVFGIAVSLLGLLLYLPLRKRPPADQP